MKLRGEIYINCNVYYRGDEIDMEKMEISENLHRGRLSALERADLTKRWIELGGTPLDDDPNAAADDDDEEDDDNPAENKLAQVAPVSGGRGNTGGNRELPVCWAAIGMTCAAT